MAFVPQSEKVQKVLLLYITDKFMFPLTEDQFIKIIIDNKFMSYIEYKAYINELIKTQQVYITEEAGLTIYKISDDGRFTLEQFIHLLPESPKEAFNEYVENNLHRIKTETLLDSSYKYLVDGQMEITCNIRERNELLMAIKLYVKDEDEAKSICKNWENSSTMMYRILMDTLLQ